MANTVIGFTINIDGISSINQLNEQIKATKASMNALNLTTEEGQKEFAALSTKLGQLTAEQKALKKTQDDLNKSFMDTSKNLGAYDKASAELNKLRKEFKNATLDGSKTSAELATMKKRISELDETLKEVDGQVGQFQRNVGNYPFTLRRVQRALMQTIPGFEMFSHVLKDGTGKITGFGQALIGGFLVFQGAKQILRAINSLDEFQKKITDVRNTVMEFSGAFGDDLDKLSANTKALADTFGTDANTIADAAKALSKEMGISFEEALGQIENTLVEGRGNATNYLNKLKEFPSTFKKAGEETGALAKENRGLLESNKELAASQINVARQTKFITTGFKEIKNNITSFLLNALMKVWEVLLPLGKAFYGLFKAVSDFTSALVSIFTGGNQTVSFLDLFIATLNLVIAPLTFVINLLTQWYSILTPFAPIIMGAVVAIGAFTLAMNLTRIQLALSAVAQWAMTGAVTAYEAIMKTAKAAQLAFNAAVKANPIGLAITGLIAAGGAVAAYAYATQDSTDATDDNTDSLKAQEDQLKASMKAEEEKSAAAIKAQQDDIEAKQKADAEKAKIDAAEKKRQDDLARDRERLLQDRKKFLEQQVQEEKNSLALLADLNARYIDEQIKNIKDSKERQSKEIDIASEREQIALDKQLQALKESNAAREAEAVQQLKDAEKLYGAESEQAKKIAAENDVIRQENRGKELQTEEEINRIKLELEKNRIQQQKVLTDEELNQQIEDAKQNAEELRALRDKLLDDRIDRVDEESNMIDLKNRESLAKALKNESDSRKRESIQRLADEQVLIDKIIAIRAKLLQLDKQEALLKKNAAMGIEIAQEEYDAIAKARQELNTELAEADLQYTDSQKANAEKRKGSWKSTFNEILDYTKQGLELLSNVLQVMAEREQARFDEDLQKSAERQERLQEEIDNSTGLRRRYYEQQLQLEAETAEKIEQAKEAARKKAAKQQKAIAIMQSIIQTALAVTAALSAGGNPLKIASGLNIVEAIAAGITGAVQTGIIAAQPLAKGGIVGKYDEIAHLPNFDSGGLVTSKGNIKPLSNGDNVLATLKTGEIVLNREQQQRVGYTALKGAKIPNFALGGVVGAPSALITENNKLAADGKMQMDMVMKMAEETSKRIDRIQVIYTAGTDDNVQKGRTERKTIQTTAQF
jgi:hypothetical protein